MRQELVTLVSSWCSKIIPRIDWSKRNILPDKKSLHNVTYEVDKNAAANRSVGKSRSLMTANILDGKRWGASRLPSHRWNQKERGIERQRGRSLTKGKKDSHRGWGKFMAVNIIIPGEFRTGSQLTKRLVNIENFFLPDLSPAERNNLLSWYRFAFLPEEAKGWLRNSDNKRTWTKMEQYQ